MLWGRAAVCNASNCVPPNLCLPAALPLPACPQGKLVNETRCLQCETGAPAWLRAGSQGGIASFCKVFFSAGFSTRRSPNHMVA